MRKYNELQKIIQTQTSKPETITEEEWVYFNQMKKLKDNYWLYEWKLLEAANELKAFCESHNEEY